MPSGDLMKAMLPSRGGRLMVTPVSMQALAGVVDVVDLVGEVAEVAPALVVLGIPVVGELDKGRLLVDAALLVLGRGEEDQGEAALLVLEAADLLQAKLA